MGRTGSGRQGGFGLNTVESCCLLNVNWLAAEPDGLMALVLSFTGPRNEEAGHQPRAKWWSGHWKVPSEKGPSSPPPLSRGTLDRNGLLETAYCNNLTAQWGNCVMTITTKDTRTIKGYMWGVVARVERWCSSTPGGTRRPGY